MEAVNTEVRQYNVTTARQGLGLQRTVERYKLLRVLNITTDLTELGNDNSGRIHPARDTAHVCNMTCNEENYGKILSGSLLY